MSKSSKVIEYLDLSIELPKQASSLFEEFLNDFEEGHDYIEVKPKIKNGFLKINSTDFIAFLGYINPTKLNEIELASLKAKARFELEQLQVKTVSLDHQSHYKWCLAALSNFEIGRFVK